MNLSHGFAYTTISRFLLMASLTVSSTIFAEQTNNQTATQPLTATKVSAMKTSPSSKSKTIVFIHGMFMTPKAWDKWQTYFQEQGYTTIAPAWPLHDTSLTQQRTAAAQETLGKLTLDEVVESYRKVIKNLPEKPIVIGHSMGGLVAQKLLSEGLASKAVAIDSAPPSGLIVAKWSFIKSNWPVINPFTNAKQAYYPSLEDFRYAFANCVPDAESEAMYHDYIVPESRLVGRGTSSKIAKIDFSKPHGPLLIVAGEKDHIIPAALNLKNFNKYSDTSSVKTFKQFDGQCHALIVDKKWNEVASSVATWLNSN